MTTTDRAALTFGVIAGLIAVAIWRRKDTAAAFYEALGPDRHTADDTVAFFKHRGKG